MSYSHGELVQLAEEGRRKKMTEHHIKIQKEFADAVISGEKTFEIRMNDRGYQKGDLIRFQVVDGYISSTFHPLNEKVFEITYVLSGWGLSEGYVVFSIKEKSDD